MPGKTDWWWEPTDSDAPQQLQQALTRYVVPFLASLPSRAALVARLEADGLPRTGTGVEKWQFAVLRHLTGELAAARCVLDDLTRDAPGFAAQTDELQQRLKSI